MSTDKPRRLGRGLEALLSAAPAATAGDHSTLQRLPISLIRPNPYQPRREFKPEELADLQASLRTSGLLQPITVRPASDGIGYELIAGERRLRAATSLGWSDIPAVVRPIDDRTLLTLALVENLQRSDLNPVEEAEGYRRLVEEFGATQQQVADVVGKNRATVANALRILALPAAARDLLERQQISAGHARALLALRDEQEIVTLAHAIVRDGLSVRDVERRAQPAGSPSRQRVTTGKTAGSRRIDPELRRVEDDLRKRLQTDVHLSAGEAGGGTITIAFYTPDDLERVLELILPGRST